MRALISTILIASLHVGVLAQTCINDPTPEQLAKFIREASDQKAPLPEGKLVVPTEEVAQAIHRAVAGAVYGVALIDRQRPLRLFALAMSGLFTAARLQATIQISPSSVVSQPASYELKTAKSFGSRTANET
jgi:hypothetical protein